MGETSTTKAVQGQTSLNLFYPIATPPVPQNQLTDEHFRRAADHYDLMTWVYGPGITAEIGTEEEGKCVDVSIVADTARHRTVKELLYEVSGRVAADEEKNVPIDNTLFWSDSILKALKGRGGEDKKLCKPDMEKIAQEEFGNEDLAPFVVKNAKAAVFVHYWAVEEAKEDKPDTSTKVGECSRLDWNEKRHWATLMWDGAFLLLGMGTITIIEKVVRRIIHKPYGGSRIRFLVSRFAIPALAVGASLYLADWLTARSKDPKCGHGFLVKWNLWRFVFAPKGLGKGEM